MKEIEKLNRQAEEEKRREELAKAQKEVSSTIFNNFSYSQI